MIEVSDQGGQGRRDDRHNTGIASAPGAAAAAPGAAMVEAAGIEVAESSYF
jgi:hypothetical protein